MWGKRTGLVGAAATIASLAFAASASALAITAQVSPSTTAAGSNVDLGITLNVQEAGDDLRDLTIRLPPGLVGDPTATRLCTVAQLNADSCPQASDVGDTTTTVDPAGLPVPIDIEGDVYNLVAQPGEPARFGVVLRPGPGQPNIITQSPARLRQSDLGLDTVLTDLPRTATLPVVGNVPIDITGLSLNLAGRVRGEGFIRFPTSCGTKTVGFDADSYSGGPASTQATFTTNRCGRLPFSPELRAVSEGKGFGPIELSTTISQTIEEAGLATAEVILPSGLTGDNELLGVRCARASFFAGSCPASTIVGSARAASPLQSEPLQGTVAIIEPADPGLPDIGLDLRGPLALKLTGELDLAASGRAVTTFAGLPDIPISDFRLTFTREPGFVVAGVDTCKARLVVDGAFLAHSGARTSVEAPIDAKGCGAQSREPRAKVKLRKLGSDQPKLGLQVNAGGERMRRVALRLPGALGFDSGAFADGVDREVERQAARGQEDQAQRSHPDAEAQAGQAAGGEARRRGVDRQPEGRAPDAIPGQGRRRRRQADEAQGPLEVTEQLDG